MNVQLRLYKFVKITAEAPFRADQVKMVSVGRMEIPESKVCLVDPEFPE